jgi:Glycosyltransferase 61
MSIVQTVVRGSDEFQGRLQSATKGQVTGWARDPQVDDRLEVGVLVDGEHVASDRALFFRESLRLAGVGDGAHAFAIDLPERMRDGARHTIAAVALATGAVLPPDVDFQGKTPPGDPWYLSDFLPDLDALNAAASGEMLVPSTTGNDNGASADGPLGRLEAVADGSAVGWAYDPRSPRQRLALEILIDGEVIAETVADLPRPSLVAEGIGDGRHSFLVKLPLSLCDAATHTIAIRLSTGELLPTAPWFATSAARAPEWEETVFVDSSAAAPGTQTAAGRTPAAAAPAVSRTAQAARTLSLRPVNELLLSRRPLHEGFSRRDGPETIVLAPEMAVALPEPLHFAVQRDVADPLLERRKRFDPPSRYPVPPLLASRLPACVVDTHPSLIIPNEHEYLLDSLRHTGALLRLGYERLDDGVIRREVGEIPERDERVVVLGAQTNVNYSHWLVESLIRVLLFRPLDDGTRLFLTPPLTDWQRQTLELVGIGPDRILELEPQGPVRFREVIAVSRGMGRMPYLRPTGVAALADLATPTTARRRIYCSRADMRRRHIANEAEVIDVLLRHGFEPLSPETLPIREQIETFAGAEVVFALHGSALTNITFSRPGTLVIELQAEGFNVDGIRWNWILASLREQPFVQIVCPLAGDSEDLPHAHRDVTVDAHHLDTLLDRLLPG